jgi:hypothetical protein
VSPRTEDDRLDGPPGLGLGIVAPARPLIFGDSAADVY